MSGYGSYPYGLSPYGSVGGGQGGSPRVIAAVALDGFRVEVFFSVDMVANAALTNVANYDLTRILGFPASPISVETGEEGDSGYISVILTHSGTTLGGFYVVGVSSLTSVDGPLTEGTAGFYALGDATVAVVTIPDPEVQVVRLDFLNSLGSPQDLLRTEEVPGVDDPSSYLVTTDYPIVPTVVSATQDDLLASRVFVELSGLTDTAYNLVTGDSTGYEYEGSVLPSADPNLSAVQVGTGSSTAGTSLSLSKSAGNTYGWELGDLSGKLTSTATFAATFVVDASTSTISPVSNETFATISVSDGVVQLDVTLEDVDGEKILRFYGGSVDETFSYDWLESQFSLTLIRNQRGLFYSVFIDGRPVFSFQSALVDQVALIPAGTAVVLSSGPTVSGFRIYGVDLLASSTIYTSTWNYLFNLINPFLGIALPASTQDRIRTRYGPLVRGWGDGTPATKLDVAVRVNGTEVEVAGVNPYVGEIYLVNPIPKTAPGTTTVEIDYKWMANPAFALAGLNVRGLSLNTWDRAQGHTAGAVSPTPSSSIGAIKTHRFPMGIVLGPASRQSPAWVGHRYIGFQKQYTALLNDSPTLRLNNNPHRFSDGGLSSRAQRETGTFRGETTPPEAETPWILSGVDSGGLVGDGTYRVVDDLSGPYGVGEAAVWSRQLDLSLTTSVDESARLRVETYTPDGVFAGVGFGVHDGGHLLLVGFLEVSGVKHVGVLLDGNNPHLEVSWAIGPSAPAEGASQTTILIDVGELPSGVEAGSRFRIAEGNQVGVYTISACGLSETDDGAQIEITFQPALPADVGVFGNDSFEVLFEVLWDSEDLIPVRIQAEFPLGSGRAYIGSQISGLVADLAEIPAYPAETALLLPALEKGVAFWGSISRRATSSSIWDIVQYSSNPALLVQTVQGITVETPMDVVPEDDESDPWYIVSGFGESSVDAGELLLKSTSGSETIDTAFSYERVEPFYTNRVSLDLTATFVVDSGVLGAGDAQIRIRDTVRQGLLSTLLYVEDPAGRRLVTDLPQASLSGLQDPSDAGWAKTGVFSNPFVRGQTLQFSKSVSSTGRWTSPALVDPTLVDYEGLIFETRVSVQSFTAGSVGIGSLFGFRVKVSPTDTRDVGVVLDSGFVRLIDSSSVVVSSYAFDWNDGDFHSLRVLADEDADTVTLVVDDVVLGSTALTSFAIVVSEPLAYLGGVGTGVCSFTVDSMSLVPLRVVAQLGETVERTLGILLRNGDPDDINGYKIPRIDGTAAPNSSFAAVPYLMNWTSSVQVRLYFDPGWGFSLYRPDLPPPPWYTGADFITETTDPTAAYITVETRELPVARSSRGSVLFGSPDPRSISQQRWDDVSYQVRGDYNGFGIAKRGMVLNRATKLVSGEFNIDVTPEVYSVTSRTSTSVYVPDCNVYADRIFSVQVDGTLLSSAEWSFDKATQFLTLSSPLPSPQYEVVVTFAPGKPISKTYLCDQPFSGSATRLNKGTPPMPLSRNVGPTRTVVTVGDYEYVEFTDGPDSLYAGIEVCEVEDGDDIHISPICDGPGPGLGLAEIGIDGTLTTDPFSLPWGPGGPWGASAVRGSATHFGGIVLHAAGGRSPRYNTATGQYEFNPWDGLMGGGEYISAGALQPAIMYPNAQGPGGAVPPGMGMNQDFVLALQDVTPREDVVDIQTLLDDNMPPSEASPTANPNPDGTPGVSGNGKITFILEDTGSNPESRMGPWGAEGPTISSIPNTGPSVLETSSLIQGGSPVSLTFTYPAGTATFNPGSAFILNGGNVVTRPVVTEGTREAA